VCVCVSIYVYKFVLYPCSDVARIQFRLPDGSSHSHNFEATATLGEVRLFAATQLKFPFR
jgi:hypothetical protein